MQSHVTHQPIHSLPCSHPLSTDQANCQLKILPVYTGVASLEEALHNPHAVRLLWLEILFNDTLDLTPWHLHQEVSAAYRKACLWYNTYRSVIDSLLARSPLPTQAGSVDSRDYRTFAKALRFVASHD